MPICPVGSVATGQITRLLLECRFDQVCQRREPLTRKAKHFSGKGAELHLNSGCINTDYFVAFHAQSRDSDIVVRSAHGVTKNDLLLCAKDSIQTLNRFNIEWEKQRVFQVKQRWLGTFLLDETKSPYEVRGPLPREIVETLAEGLFEQVSFLPEAWRDFQTRLLWVERQGIFSELQTQMPEGPRKDLLLKFAEALCEGSSRLEDIFEKDWREVYFFVHPCGPLIRSALSNFPDSITLMNGKVKKIFYVESSPHIEGRVQDFYGLREHPSLFQGRIKLKLILLGPHQRPIQITSDLPSFWKSSYPSIKKELKGQYPKHFWPDSPEVESPPVPHIRK